MSRGIELTFGGADLSAFEAMAEGSVSDSRKAAEFEYIKKVGVPHGE